MIVKFAASELNFQLTTDDGVKIIDVEVGNYKGELNTAEIPTIQKELLSVLQQIMSNVAKLK